MNGTLGLKSLDVHLRFPCQADIDTIKELCKQWFPIQYPDFWYEEITTNQKFYSLVATINHEIVGLLVTEIKPYLSCNQEDLGLLSRKVHKNSRAVYILTLGVVYNYRRHGIATIMLNKLIENLTVNPLLEDCKAIYLHVLTTNKVAINFYEKLSFQQHRFLPNYYCINRSSCDGYSYVLYLNGGAAPLNFLYIFNCKLHYLLMKRLFCRQTCRPFSIVNCERIWCLQTFLSYVLPLKWIKKCTQNFIAIIYRKFSLSSVKQQNYLYTC